MSKRFTNIEIDNRGDIILLDDNGVFTVYNLQELEDFLNKQDQRINELETKNRNAEHLINILEENKLENIGSSLKLFTENAKLKVKINELEGEGGIND